MTRISRILAVPTVGAGYDQDRVALEEAYVPLPQRFTAPPRAEGFRAVSQESEAVSVGLVLEDLSNAPAGGRRVAWGDCVAGAEAGRMPPFRSDEGLATIREAIVPLFEGRALDRFRPLAVEVDALTELVEVLRPRSEAPTPGAAGVSRRALLTAPARILQAARGENGVAMEKVIVARQLHPAVRYGVSQALLQAVALARGLTMAEVVAEEWDLPRPAEPVPLHGCSGHERYYDAEKMIVRHLASLPHAAVDDVAGQVGRDGAELMRYLRWLKERIGTLGGQGYRPTIHLDLRGALGRIYDNDLGKILGQVYAMEMAVAPYALRLQDPLIHEDCQTQIEAMTTLRDYIRFRKMTVGLVAGAWADRPEGIRAFLQAKAADALHVRIPQLGSLHHAVEAVLACKAAGVGVLLGGTPTETHLSVQVSVHVALATQPDLIVARPGLGVDEAVSLVRNEMARALAVISYQ